MSDQPITVVVFAADLWVHVCPVVRIAGPAQLGNITVLHGNYWESGEIKINADKVSEADVILIQRNFPQYTEAYEAIVAAANRLKIPVVYELDDLLTELPVYHPDYLHFRKTRAACLNAAVQADAVIVSTPTLQRYLQQFNPNVYIFPNYFQDQLLPAKIESDPLPEDKVVIGFMGGHSHIPDIEMVGSLLVTLVKRYEGKLTLRFWGVPPPSFAQDLPGIEIINPYLVDYAEFMAYFATQNASIFIAPLLDNLFNRAKSHLKFLEYSMLGVPGVYSALPTYQQIVEHGKNGFLAQTEEDWETYLVQLIESPVLRNEMGQAARKTVTDNWLISKNSHSLTQIYQEIKQHGSQPKNEMFSLLSQKLNRWYEEVESSQKIDEDNSNPDAWPIGAIKFKQEIDALEYKDKLLKNEVFSLRVQNSALKDQNSVMKNNHETLKTEVESLQSKNISLRNHNTALQSENINLRTHIGNVESSNIWKMLVLFLKVSTRILPPDSARRKLVSRFLKFAFRVAQRLFAIITRRGSGSRQQEVSGDNAPPTPNELQNGPPQFSYVFQGGEPCLTPSIGVIVSNDQRDAVMQWVASQTIASLVEVIVWDATVAGASTAELEDLLAELPINYICIASPSLLAEPSSFLEANLIALETEKLVFTINVRGPAEWTREQFGKGHFPGETAYPLERIVTRKEAILPGWTLNPEVSILGDAGNDFAVGKVLFHRSNDADTLDSLSFETRLSKPTFLFGDYVIYRRKDQDPFTGIVQPVRSVKQVMPVIPLEDERPTVLVLISFLAIGGAERLLLTILEHLSAQIRFVVMTVEGMDPALGTSVDEVRTITPFVYQAPDFLPTVMNFEMLEYLIERFGVSSIYIPNGSNWTFDHLERLRQYHPDIRLSIQNYDHNEGWINRYNEQVAQMIDIHIAPNVNIQQAYIRKGVRLDQIAYLEHGTDLRPMDPAKYPPEKREEIRTRLGIPAKKKIVAFIGRIHPQKRPMDFVELARRFSNNEDVFFLMVGDGALRDPIAQQIKRSQLTNIMRLDFYQPSSEIHALLDVLVLPSAYEGMPLVIAEALAMGKPVVVTDVGNNRDVVETVKGGVIVSRIGDISALQRGVEEMLKNPPDANAIRQAILARFDIPLTAKKHRDVFLPW